ncbi:MAG: heparinase, partial [Planctomycetales bacterium]|nr:heparinase [Planctomycetales bacterium]NIP69656.1 heparinase [Planctomycetales bacterium]
TPLVDPGSETYTARTFSGRRYESDVLNSFGHPVPRVAGNLQLSGRQAAAEVLKTEFTEQTDTIVLDLRKAYAAGQLRKLQRTFIFSRQQRGRLTVVDEAQFDNPQDFGTALIT